MKVKHGVVQTCPLPLAPQSLSTVDHSQDLLDIIAAQLFSSRSSGCHAELPNQTSQQELETRFQLGNCESEAFAARASSPNTGSCHLSGICPWETPGWNAWMISLGSGLTVIQLHTLDKSIEQVGQCKYLEQGGIGGRHKLLRQNEPAFPELRLCPDALRNKTCYLVCHEGMQDPRPLLDNANEESHKHDRQGLPACENAK